MAEALLYERLSNSRVRCNVCQWHCVIGTGKSGVCRVRKNDGGVLKLLNYAEAVSMAPDPIEKKPLFHFFPGSSVFSLGTWGCNFHCTHCQNWEISCIEESSSLRRDARQIMPEDAVALARQLHCAGIAWTYNEPSIWFEYTLDTAKLAKENGLYTVYVTNGYITPEAMDMIGPYLDAWRVDIKGFSDELYRTLAKIHNWRGILDVAVRAKTKWQMHIEVVTNIIPTMNDDNAQLTGLAKWIRNVLGELTPWHVTRFYPHYHLQNLPPTPIETLEKAYNIGKAEGLRFIYTGNVPGHDKENTYCYSCGKLVIRRTGFSAHVVGVENSKCSFCGAELNVKMG
jgi:pyruvate formate lyase activating enzyme